MDGEKCFAESKHGKKCRALECGKCIGHIRCTFYATKAQHKDSVLRAYARLRMLPPSKQDYIAKKYYGGEYPWNQVDE